MNYFIASALGFIAGGIVMGIYAASIKAELRDLRARVESEAKSIRSHL